MSGHLRQDGVYRPAPFPPSHLLHLQPSACHVQHINLSERTLHSHSMHHVVEFAK